MQDIDAAIAELDRCVNQLGLLGSYTGTDFGIHLDDAKLDPFFEELARVVRPGGRIALLDVSRPKNRLLRFGYDIYFGKIVPLIGGLLSNADAYHYLPRSLSYLPEPQVLSEQVRAAGFSTVEHHQLNGGLVQLITATR